MLNDFLRENKRAILELTEKKTLELAGKHPSSDQLKRGLPILYGQILEVLARAGSPNAPPAKDVAAIAQAADRGDEPAMAEAANQPLEADLARSAGLHGAEMLRLGYTLSHVVHAYGALCQSITEVATAKDVLINSSEFHALNRCLDVAIAGAVTDFQSRKDSRDARPEDPDGESVFKEMRSALLRANIAFQAIQRGAVGAGGSTAKSLAKNLARLEELIDQSAGKSDAARPGRD
jgi:hypothetical protein